MTIMIKKPGYWCLRVAYTLCQCPESDGRNFLAAIVQPTILNDNVNQFKVGLESDKGYFTLKVKTMTLMYHFFCPQ
jgi:hypothetical protein